MSDSISPSASGQRGLSLRDILPGATFHNTSDLTVRSCSGIWSECQPDDLFVALVGNETDGHNDVNLALQRGASAVLTERLLPIGSPQCIVDDSRIAFGQIAHALAGDPCSRLMTVAVGGDDGKTSTAHLIHSILSAAGIESGLASSLSGKKPGTGETPWNPLRLAGFLAKQEIAGCRAAIVETESAELSGHLLAGATFDATVVTNVRKRRPGGRGQPQLRLVRHLKPGGVAVVNADDPLSASLLNQINVATLTVGIREPAEVQGKILESSAAGQTFSIRAGSESILITTDTPGAAHVYNCLQATAMGLSGGIDLATIGRGLGQFRPLPGRLNALQCGQDFSVIVDQAGTSFRLGGALNMLRRHVAGRIICVFSPPADCTPDVAARFGRTAERGCDLPVITRPQLAPSLDLESDHQVLDGFDRPAGAHLIPDRITAIEWALSQAEPGDAVLVAGRGERSICSLAENRWQLTDTDVCQAWLFGNSAVNQTIVPPVVNQQIFRIDDYRPC